MLVYQRVCFRAEPKVEIGYQLRLNVVRFWKSPSLKMSMAVWQWFSVTQLSSIKKTDIFFLKFQTTNQRTQKESEQKISSTKQIQTKTLQTMEQKTLGKKKKPQGKKRPQEKPEAVDIPDPGIPEVCSYGSPCFGLYRLGTTWNRLAKLPVWRLGRVGGWGRRWWFRCGFIWMVLDMWG